MTALHDALATLPEQRTPLPEEVPPVWEPPVAGQPRKRGLPRWVLPTTAGALIAVMAATTAVALLRAGDRGDRLAATRRELATTQASLAAARTNLDTEQRALTQSRAEVTELETCVDSFMEFLGAAAAGDVAAATSALTRLDCRGVFDPGMFT